MSFRRLSQVLKRPRSVQSKPALRDAAAIANIDGMPDEPHDFASIASASWSGFKLFLSVVREVAGAFPPLDATVGGLIALISIYDLVRSNFDWMEDIMTRLDRTLALLASRLDENRESGLASMSSTHVAALQKQLNKVQALRDRTWISRGATSKNDESGLKAIYQTIADVLQELQLELAISVEKNTKSIMQDLVLQNLPYATTAAYTAATSAAGISRRGCTDGTRVKILQDILHWARDESRDVPRLLWISGLAGQGKSTIAYSVCERLDEDALDVSVVSFFCSRRLDSSREALLVSTLVLKLAQSSASCATEVVNVLKQEYDLGYQKLEVQMKKLFIDPWQRSASLREGFPVTLLVVDALDEQDTGIAFARLLIEALSEGSLPGMRAIFTSRLEAPFHALLRKWSSCCTNAVVQHLNLNDQLVADRDTLDADILCYLNAELPQHRNTQHLKRLAEASAGLFIYASTAVRLIKSDAKQSKARSEEERHILELSAHYDYEAAGSGTHDTMLDSLYAGIIADTFDGLTHSQTDARMHILITFIIFRRTVPMGIGFLTELAGPGFDEEVTELVIASLHAVLYIDAETGKILCCHASFEDYMWRAYEPLINRARRLLVQDFRGDFIPVREKAQCVLPSCVSWNLSERGLALRNISAIGPMGGF
ncbi:unnamed protein product [Peniophora sp. CBMAI 1063]|nr:unnamed protein product [Peniophora sp. CBMAI 1063]